MELAPCKEPWTAAVAWARPWHRPAARALPDPALEVAWHDALAELRAARETLAGIAQDVDDPWQLALARHDVFMARRKLRQAQEALTPDPADLPWSTC